MHQLPEPPAAPAAGQPTPLADAVIEAAVENAIEKARRHDTTPEVVIGNTPPVPQPGRPAMSEKATDDSVRMIAFGGMTLMMCAGGGIVMVASEFADPTVIGMICAAPIALAFPIWALGRFAKSLKGALPEQHQHTYNGPVYQDQRTQQTKTSGLWARTDNRQ